MDHGVVPQDGERKVPSQRHERVCAKALSRQGRPGRIDTCDPSCNVASDDHRSLVEAGQVKLKLASRTATEQWTLKQLLGLGVAVPNQRSRPRGEVGRNISNCSLPCPYFVCMAVLVPTTT